MTRAVMTATMASTAIACQRAIDYGLLANARRKSNLATARTLLHQPAPTVAIHSREAPTGTGHAPPTFRWRHCGAPMLILETFARVPHIRGPPAAGASA